MICVIVSWLVAMMGYRKFSIILRMSVIPVMALFFASLTATGQNLTKRTDEVNQMDDSYLIANLRYMSDYVYMGRKDSLDAPYLSPYLGYFHRSGLFIDGSVSYLLESGENRIDMISATVGYDYFGKRISTGASTIFYLFNEDSYVIPSVMDAYLNGYIGYDFYFVELYGDVGLGLSNDLDIFGRIELRRTFFMGKDRFRITPSANMNAGTQYYYTEYYGTRNSKVTGGNGFGGGAGSGQGGGTAFGRLISIDNETLFQILDYEFRLELAYKTDRLKIAATPTVALPVNPATVTVDDTVTFEESLSTQFYWSVSITYQLNK